MNAQVPEAFWKIDNGDFVRIHEDAGHYLATVVAGGTIVVTKVFPTHIEAHAWARSIHLLEEAALIDDSSARMPDGSPPDFDLRRLVKVQVARASVILEAMRSSLDALPETEFQKEWNVMLRWLAQGNPLVSPICFEFYDARAKTLEELPAAEEGDDLPDGCGIAAHHIRESLELEAAFSEVSVSLSHEERQSGRSILEEDGNADHIAQLFVGLHTWASPTRDQVESGRKALRRQIFDAAQGRIEAHTEIKMGEKLVAAINCYPDAFE